MFLHDLTDFWSENNRLADLGTDFLYDTGRVINAMPHRAGSIVERTPLMHEMRARRGGVRIPSQCGIWRAA